jgi:ribosomal protein L4
MCIATCSITEADYSQTYESRLPHVDLIDQRFQALGSLLAPQSFEVPPPKSPTNLIGSAAAKQQASKASGQEKKKRKKEQKFQIKCKKGQKILRGVRLRPGEHYQSAA